MGGDDYRQLQRRMSRVVRIDELVDAERAKRACFTMEPHARAQSKTGGVAPMTGVTGDAFRATVPSIVQLASRQPSQPAPKVCERPAASAVFPWVSTEYTC